MYFCEKCVHVKCLFIAIYLIECNIFFCIFYNFMSHYIEVVPNRKYRPTKLLRKAWRGGKKVKRTIIANLSYFHLSVIEGFKAAIKGGE